MDTKSVRSTQFIVHSCQFKKTPVAFRGRSFLLGRQRSLPLIKKSCKACMQDEREDWCAGSRYYSDITRWQFLQPNCLLSIFDWSMGCLHLRQRCLGFGFPHVRSSIQRCIARGASPVFLLSPVSPGLTPISWFLLYTSDCLLLFADIITMRKEIVKGWGL